jgi:hypothetical protein
MARPIAEMADRALFVADYCKVSLSGQRIRATSASAESPRVSRKRAPCGCGVSGGLGSTRVAYPPAAKDRDG